MSSSEYWCDSSTRAGSDVEPSPQSIDIETGPRGSSATVVMLSSPARLRWMRPCGEGLVDTVSEGASASSILIDP